MLIHSCTKIASELLFHAISQLSFRFMRIQAFPRELVDDVQHAIFPPIVSAIFDEVVRPNMVWILWPQPDARSVIEPESSSLRLLIWNPQPLPPQIRSTRLKLTTKPASRSSAVIWR